MKEVTPKDLPEVSGGVKPTVPGGGCTLPPVGYPREPMVPLEPDPTFSDPSLEGGM